MGHRSALPVGDALVATLWEDATPVDAPRLKFEVASRLKIGKKFYMPPAPISDGYDDRLVPISTAGDKLSVGYGDTAFDLEWHIVDDGVPYARLCCPALLDTFYAWFLLAEWASSRFAFPDRQSKVAMTVVGQMGFQPSWQSPPGGRDYALPISLTPRPQHHVDRVRRIQGVVAGVQIAEAMGWCENLFAYLWAEQTFKAHLPAGAPA